MAHLTVDNLLSYLPFEFANLDRETNDLRNFLEIVAVSMEEFEDFIEDFTSIFDVDNCDPKYLPYLAKMLNYPLSQRDNVASQRLQLKYAVEWYKHKGLHESFRVLFYSLGYVINLVELWTRDYQKFYKYPGTFLPSVTNAKVTGTGIANVSISASTRRLRIGIDGGPPVDVVLTTGLLRDLAGIATEIEAALLSVGGTCYLDSGVLTIQSTSAGAGSVVKLFPSENSAYPVLGLSEISRNGIDETIPDDWPELKENGGKWYKSPHFGIEVYSIKDYLLDPEEFAYIRERIELVRPAHTVLDWIDYIKSVGDQYYPTEGNYIAEITPELAEVWPFPVCIDRGELCEFEYIRDGLVPDRSDDTRISYKHIRNALDNCARRDQFVYEYTELFRNSPTGPVQMPMRDTIRFYREGYVTGEPNRASCAFDSEVVDILLGMEIDESWCAEVLRDGGLYYRDVDETYFRDGTFSELTWRGQSFWDRDGLDQEFLRAGCFPIFDGDNFLLFNRPDFPTVWFRSLAAMTDPFTLDLPEMPGPGEIGGVVS